MTEPMFITDEGPADIDTESPASAVQEIAIVAALGILFALAAAGLGFLLFIASARGWLPI